uniref:Cullin domain-containing protein n=1 Tax=Steinernema glaseri TaxID=37863 RepID=A0A1I7XY51_9BILA
MNANLDLTVDGAFEALKDTLAKVFCSEENAAIEYMDIHKKIQQFYDPLRQSTGSLMYGALIRFLRQFISEKAAQIGALTTPVDRLLEYQSAWENFIRSVETIDGIFSYFSKNWVKPTAEDGEWEVVDDENEDTVKLYEVSAICLFIWMEEMFKKMPEVVIQSALAVQKEGEDGVESARVDLFKVALDSLVEWSATGVIDIGTIEQLPALLLEEEEEEDEKEK